MEGLLACLCSGPCGTTLATAFGSDLRSVDTLRSSRVALTQPDAYGAGESRMTTNRCRLAERLMPLKGSDNALA